MARGVVEWSTENSLWRAREVDDIDTLEVGQSLLDEGMCLSRAGRTLSARQGWDDGGRAGGEGASEWVERKDTSTILGRQPLSPLQIDSSPG